MRDLLCDVTISAGFWCFTLVTIRMCDINVSASNIQKKAECKLVCRLKNKSIHMVFMDSYSSDNGFSILYRSQMEVQSSRKSSPMMPCLIQITLIWRTTAGGKILCINQPSGECHFLLKAKSVFTQFHHCFLLHI